MKVFLVCLFCCMTNFTQGKDITVKGNDDNWFRFASYYQNKMVLQREPHRANIWGYGMLGANMTLSISGTNYTTTVRVGPNKASVWNFILHPYKAGGPFSIKVYHEFYGLLTWIELKDVLFGDVWICSGQSNMQFTVSMTFNLTEELKAASKYDKIRLFTVGSVEYLLPLYDLVSVIQPWSIPSAETLVGPPWTYFSAVCWFYGKKLYEVLGVPIGLISSAYIGSAIEPWSSPDALKTCGLFKPNLTDINEIKNVAYPFVNSILWNVMIHPLLNMTIKGVIWYQGESNTEYHNERYSCSFPAMIRDWRLKWYEGTNGNTHKQFPFGFVQLSAVGIDSIPNDGKFPLIRWHQTADYGFVPNKVMPNTFMAVTMDLPDLTSPLESIHPRDKQDVAQRLLLGSLKLAYGHDVNSEGPLPNSIRSYGKSKILLQYPTTQHLIVQEKGNFEVCCDQTKCKAADPYPSLVWKWAPISYHTNHTITLDAQKCRNIGMQAQFVRYAWALAPCKFKQCSVYNDNGLPAPPFFLPVIL
ncbi:sialate O-acetylesterase-like [Ciona intestinalis]